MPLLGDYNDLDLLQGLAGDDPHPAKTRYSYKSEEMNEYPRFLAEFVQRRQVEVLDNPRMLHVLFYHGHNTWNEAQVTHHESGWRELDGKQRAWVDKIRAGYGVT